MDDGRTDQQSDLYIELRRTRLKISSSPTPLISGLVDVALRTRSSLWPLKWFWIIKSKFVFKGNEIPQKVNTYEYNFENKITSISKMSEETSSLDTETFLKSRRKYYPTVPYLILFLMLGCHSWAILSTSFTAWSPNSYICLNARQDIHHCGTKEKEKRYSRTDRDTDNKKIFRF